MSDSPRAIAALIESADILDMVLRCLSPGYIAEAEADYRGMQRRRTAQTTLACLARTCRTFSHPALDLLWRSVDDIVHLLSVLPCFGPLAANTKEYTFRRTITTDEWVRFQEYASRVQEVRVHSNKLYTESSVWSVLSRRCHHNEALLPRCERLLAFRVAHASSGFAELMLLQSPNLRHLELDITTYIEASIEALRMFMEEAMPTIQRLDTLSLSLPWNIDDELERSEPKFWEYTHLRSLTLATSTKFTEPILRALINFPHLDSLNLRLGTVELGDQPLEGGFHQLKKLSLVGAVEGVHRLVQAASLPCVDTINIRFQDMYQENAARTSELVRDIYETLGPSLREVHLAFENTYLASDYLLFPNATGLLTPLLNRNLTALTFHFQNLFAHILDRELQDITSTWPQLTAFEFTYNREVPEYMTADQATLADVAIPTVSTIVDFAAGHPHLERLALPHLNARVVPPLSEVSLRHPLLSFTVAYLPAGAALCPAALVFDRLFPDLDIPDGEELEHYSKLQLLLLGMQTMRRSVTHVLPRIE